MPSEKSLSPPIFLRKRARAVGLIGAEGENYTTIVSQRTRESTINNRVRAGVALSLCGGLFFRAHSGLSSSLRGALWENAARRGKRAQESSSVFN